MRRRRGRTHVPLRAGLEGRAETAEDIAPKLRKGYIDIPEFRKLSSTGGISKTASVCVRLPARFLQQARKDLTDSFSWTPGDLVEIAYAMDAEKRPVLMVRLVERKTQYRGDIQTVDFPKGRHEFYEKTGKRKKKGK